jgi:hypothetical protein
MKKLYLKLIDHLKINFRRKNITMENKSIKIEKLLIEEDILSCVKIINHCLTNMSTEGNNGLQLEPSYLKDKDGKTRPLLEKAKVAVERLNILLDEYSK